MMSHLDEGKARQRERLEEDRCENCRMIDIHIALTIEMDLAAGDLHYCANCDRLLSASADKLWEDVK